MSLQQLGVSSRCAVVPNGVDLDYFSAAQTLRPDQEWSSSELLTTTRAREASGISATKSLPLIRARLPEASFTAIGRNPSKRLRDLAGSGSGIEFTGRVEDLRPVVQKGRVFVVPLLSGSGTRLKILEAMAMGIPVVSTSIGAEGIAARDGEHLRIADTPENFAQAVADLMGDWESRRHLAVEWPSSGRSCVQLGAVGPATSRAYALARRSGTGP